MTAARGRLAALALAAVLAAVLAAPGMAAVPGELDASFSDPRVVGTAYAVEIEPGGKVIVAGTFESVGGQPRRNVARLNPDGSLDTTFGNPYVDGTVYSVAVQPDGKVIIGGDFTSIAGIARVRVARLNSNGTVDTAFGNSSVTGANPSSDPAQVYSVAPLSSGKVLIGGNFSRVGGSSRTNLARLSPDGTLDTTFSTPTLTPSGPDEPIVRAVSVQGNGQLLIGGSFGTVAGQPRVGAARLNAGGTLDTTFANPSFAANFESPSVKAIAAQADGGILAAGAFDSAGGQPRGDVARVGSGGALDTGFSAPSFAGSFQRGLSSMALQGDGKVLVGGGFTTLGGQDRRRLARLNADGTLDTSFADPAVATSPGDLQSTSVQGIALQSDGKIVIGGHFGSVGGQPRANVARVGGTSPGGQGTNPGGGSGTNPVGGSGSAPAATVTVGSVTTRITSRGAWVGSRVRVSGPGKVTQTLTSGTKKLKTWCRSSVVAKAAGTVKLKCQLGPRGRKALRKSALRLTLRTTFTPTTGVAVTNRLAVKIKRRR